MAAQVARREEEGDARTRRQRRGDRRARRRPRPRRGTHRVRRLLSSRAVVHLGAACARARRSCSTRLRDELIPRVEALVVGDPNDEDTDVGPLIDGDALDRVDEWVKRRSSSGAKALCGGQARRPLLPADGADGRASGHEGVVQRGLRSGRDRCSHTTSFDEALAMANETDYGLQAGVFTNDVREGVPCAPRDPTSAV